MFLLVIHMILPDGGLRRDERGDVPGWVMLCLMTAGFVAALAAIAGPRLTGMLDQALTSVGG